MIAILLPALVTAREAARSVVCMSQLRQIGTANEVFMVDHNGRLPSRSAWTGTPSSPGSVSRWRPWYLWSLAPYLNLEQNPTNAGRLASAYDAGLPTICPTDGMSGWWGRAETDPMIRAQPSSYAPFSRWMRMGTNAYGITSANPQIMSFAVFPRRDEVLSPAELMYIKDGGWSLRGSTTVGSLLDADVASWSPGGILYNSMKRHQDRYDNILFFDTHVEKWTSKDVEQAQQENKAVYRRSMNPFAE